MVTDAIHLCQRAVRALSTRLQNELTAEEASTPSGGRSSPAADAGAKKAPHPGARAPMEGKVDSRGDRWKDLYRRAHDVVHVIGDHSHVVGKLLLYPFIVLALLIVARAPMWDSCNFSLPLFLVLGMLLLGMLAHSVMLRLRAGDMKREIVNQLNHGLTAAPSDARQDLEGVIKDIERETSGALGPWNEDPILKAIAILLAGPGGIVAVDQLLSVMR
jgi:hypothetical protein